MVGRSPRQRRLGLRIDLEQRWRRRDPVKTVALRGPTQIVFRWRSHPQPAFWKPSRCQVDCLSKNMLKHVWTCFFPVFNKVKRIARGTANSWSDRGWGYATKTAAAASKVSQKQAGKWREPFLTSLKRRRKNEVWNYLLQSLPKR